MYLETKYNQPRANINVTKQHKWRQLCCIHSIQNQDSGCTPEYSHIDGGKPSTTNGRGLHLILILIYLG
jgi:hypothetical protein